MRIPSRYRRLDAWRGFRIPGPAIAGASDTGESSDSPCPTHVAKAEIRRLQTECLIPAGIKSRQRMGSSANVFCGKRWVCVAPKDFHKAKELAEAWLHANRYTTQLIHNANGS